MTAELPRLTTTRRAALEAIVEGEGWTADRSRAFTWLHNVGLLAWLKDSPGTRCLTVRGWAAIRQPFISQVDAQDAVSRWRSRYDGRQGAVMGWVVLRCQGGGFAVRVGLEGGPSVLLPRGLDPDRLPK